MKQIWMKWTAGAVLSSLAVIALPAITQARHYTGTTPASVNLASPLPVKSLTAAHHRKVLAVKHKHTTLVARHVRVTRVKHTLLVSKSKKLAKTHKASHLHTLAAKHRPLTQLHTRHRTLGTVAK